MHSLRAPSELNYSTLEEHGRLFCFILKLLPERGEYGSRAKSCEEAVVD
jgi:hypothetical protein